MSDTTSFAIQFTDEELLFVYNSVRRTVHGMVQAGFSDFMPKENTSLRLKLIAELKARNLYTGS